MTNERITALKRRWQAEAKRHLLGRKIIDARWMSGEEQEALGWDNAAVVLLLDDGTLAWPSADDEGNDAGALFGADPSGDDFVLPVIV